MEEEYIILTKAQADRVRGISIAGHALEPREMLDGKFALPVRVLDDPAHEKHKGFLQGLTRRKPVLGVEWKTTAEII